MCVHIGQQETIKWNPYLWARTSVSQSRGGVSPANNHIAQKNRGKFHILHKAFTKKAVVFL